jgi:hypothetical protein
MLWDLLLSAAGGWDRLERSNERRKWQWNASSMKMEGGERRPVCWMKGREKEKYCE